MKVINIHERELDAAEEQVGSLIDSLGSREDALWPIQCWPRIKLDRPLGIGAAGGHGPIGYVCEAYTPGRSVQFRFTRPKGFKGLHKYEVLQNAQSSVVLRHTIEMNVRGLALLTWPLVIRPLHDALLEDSLSTAQASLGQEPQMRPWSLWVRLLRRVMSRGKAGLQVAPVKAGDGT